MLILVACGHRPATRTPRWQPASDSETVMVLGDTTYRVTGAGDVAVTVVVRLAGAEATGSAVVLNTSLVRARSSPHIGLATARAWYALAQQHAGEAAVAYDAAHAGLESLGTHFAPIGLKDDTVFLITTAEEKRAPNPVDAARELGEILYGRLRKYTIRWHSEVL